MNDVLNINNSELWKMAMSHDPQTRAVAAKYADDQMLDFLISDESEVVRKRVAMHGRLKDLDVLVHDPSWYVRYSVAEHCIEKYLDILVHDDCWAVRSCVASFGIPKYFDILKNDLEYHVFCAVRDNYPMDEYTY